MKTLVDRLEPQSKLLGARAARAPAPRLDRDRQAIAGLERAPGLQRRRRSSPHTERRGVQRSRRHTRIRSRPSARIFEGLQGSARADPDEDPQVGAEAGPSSATRRAPLRSRRASPPGEEDPEVASDGSSPRALAVAFKLTMYPSTWSMISKSTATHTAPLGRSRRRRRRSTLGTSRGPGPDAADPPR